VEHRKEKSCKKKGASDRGKKAIRPHCGKEGVIYTEKTLPVEARYRPEQKEPNCEEKGERGTPENQSMRWSDGNPKFVIRPTLLFVY